MEENEKIEREGSLDNIVFSENNKSNNTKKIAVIAIIVILLTVIMIVIFTSFSSKDDAESGEKINLPEDKDPFFMDSPADIMEESHKDSQDKFQESDNEFDKEALLDGNSNGDTFAQNDKSMSSTASGDLTHKATEEGESLLQDNYSHQPLVQHTAPVDRTPTIDETLTSERKYYIQAGTFLKQSPNDKFLKAIENLGLTPIIDAYTNKNGTEIKRVLIGPFENKGDASGALQTVRESLVKDAYILKTRLH